MLADCLFDIRLVSCDRLLLKNYMMTMMT